MDPFTSLLGHPFCNTDGLRLRHPQRCSTPQQGWTRPHRSLGIHSATRMDYASRILNGAPLRDKDGPVYLAPRAFCNTDELRLTHPQRRSTPQQRWTRSHRPSGIHSATRVDYASGILNGVPLRNKDGPVHIAPWASILQHGWITPHTLTALHSATKMDPFTSPLGHPFCNTDRLHFTLPQQCSTLQHGGTHLHRPLGTHSVTRTNYTSHSVLLHIRGYAPHRHNGTHHSALWASILQDRWITPHTTLYSATRTDMLHTALIVPPFGHRFHNTHGYTLVLTQRFDPQQERICSSSSHRHSSCPSDIKSATRMDSTSPLCSKNRYASHRCTHIATQTDYISQFLISGPRCDRRTRLTSPQQHSSVTPVGHPFCNTDGCMYHTSSAALFATRTDMPHIAVIAFIYHSLHASFLQQE